jgi:hypothetical protein
MGLAVSSMGNACPLIYSHQYFSGFLYLRGQENNWYLFFAFFKIIPLMNRIFQPVKPAYKRNV